jgi:hypothetical protein
MTKSSGKERPEGGTHRKKGGVLPAFWIAFSMCMILVLASSSSLWGEEDSRDSYEKIADAVGKTLYFLAWPTAEYERATLGGVSFATGGADVSFRLQGKSGFSGDHLWVDVVLEIRNSEITNIRWGDNNAILAQPGTTIKAMGEALAQLNEEYTRSQDSRAPGNQFSGPAGGSQGFGYYFLNSCSRPIALAIRYQEVTGQWRTDGWWNFAPGQGSYLFSGGKQIRSKNAIWYFYAETVDGSDWNWTGDYSFSLSGRNLRMQEMTDKEGDSEWSITCK